MMRWIQQAGETAPIRYGREAFTLSANGWVLRMQRSYPVYRATPPRGREDLVRNLSADQLLKARAEEEHLWRLEDWEERYRRGLMSKEDCELLEEGGVVCWLWAWERIGNSGTQRPPARSSWSR